MMKIYLLILSVVVLQALPYRYLDAKSLALPNSPKNISYLAPNVFVAQDGQNIYLYNTLTDTILQSFQSDSNDPLPQVAGQFNQVIFKNKNSLFQMQSNDRPVTLIKMEVRDQWVYPLGLANNTIVYHLFDPVEVYRQISYVKYLEVGEYLIQPYRFKNPNQNILKGSGVQALSPTEYYFVSGGICNDTLDQVLFFFRGDQKGIYNVFNLSIPGCNMPPSQTKETLRLATVDQGNQDRVHAVTYKLTDDSPFMSTTQVIRQVDTFYEEWIRFDTFNLIGVDYLGSSLYTADKELCRILQHYPDSYKKAQVYTSVLPIYVTDTAISGQNLQIAVFNDTKTFTVFKINGGTGKIMGQLFTNQPSTASFKDGDYYGSNIWIARDSITNQLSTIYLEYTPNKTTSSIKNTGYTVVDYCGTQAQAFFSVQSNGPIYTLNLNTISATDIANLSIQTSFSTGLPSAVQSIKCLDGKTVLVIPLNEGDLITVWQSNSTDWNQIGSLTKNNTLHNQIHTTATSIVFIDVNYESMLVYDFRLKLVSSSLQPILPPNAAFTIVASAGSNIVFAIGSGGDLTQPDTLDHYTLVDSSLTYVGSYPLYGTNQVDFSKIILIADIGRLSIDYGTQASSFDVSYPPQSLRGYFYDSVQLDCSGYVNAIFKPDPVPDIFDMLVLNLGNINPVIQRYTFTQITVGLLQKTSVVTIDNYQSFQIQMGLSTDGLKALVYGVKLTKATELRAVQIINANNLDTLFQKELFDVSAKQKLQAFGLYNSQFITAITEPTFLGSRAHVLNITIDSGSLGKISTDSTIVAIDLFSTCYRCSFVAVATYNTKLIQTLSLKTGVNGGNITVNCNLRQIVLSPDGNRIAYLCQNNGLYVFDRALEQPYFLAGNFTKITSIYFLNNSYIIFINNGTVWTSDLAILGQSKRQAGSIQFNNQPATSSPVQTVAINYNTQTYAYIYDPQLVVLNYKEGAASGQFFFDDPSQSIESIAFDPLNQLIVTTNTSKLITLTTSDCPTNSTVDNLTGYCTCNPTYALVNSTCMCSSPLYLESGSCRCTDGNYNVSNTQCAECNVMCDTCSGEGVSNCTRYSALFVIIIVVACLIVAGLGIFWIYKNNRKETRFQQVRKSAANKRKHNSNFTSERLVEQKFEPEQLRREE